MASFGLGLLLAAAAVAQSPPAEWRAPPPADAIERMRKSVPMGRDQGYSAKLKGVEITDSRFKPFLIQITLKGERHLGLHTARFVTDAGEFTSKLPPRVNPRWDGSSIANAPTGGKFTATTVEERTFNIELSQAELLAGTETLEITLVGRLQERHYRIKPKALGALRDWLTPRIEKYTAQPNV